MTATPARPDASADQQSTGSAAVGSDEEEASGKTGEDLSGPLYVALLERELKGERERRAALETRAVSVITTSGAFVTLSFGLVAVVTKAADYEPSPPVVVLLVVAAGALLTAAVFALLASRLRFYSVVSAEQFRTWTEPKFWSKAADQARYLIAHADSDTLASLRKGNSSKADRLELALWAQIVAFVLLGVAIAAMLITGN